VAARLIHAWLHVMGEDVIARARAFMAGFFILIAMAIRVATLVAFNI
jgi:hypothetical protein